MERKKLLTIKRELDIKKMTKDSKELLLLNMGYRHKTYNMGIEYIKDHDDRFNNYEFDSWYYENFQKGDAIYENLICKGIRSEVANDLAMCVNTVWTHRKDGLRAKFKFRRYNPYKQSFRLYNKHKNYISIISSNILHFKVTKDIIMKVILKEDIRNSIKYYFNESDIRTITFLKKNNKFYISLQVEVTLNETMFVRQKLAGIDFGIKNPVVLYDGKSFYKGGNNVKKRIKQINKRLDKLMKYLSKKEYMSNNYIKLLEKIQRIYVKISNIRLDWRNKISNHITTNYSNVVADFFKVSEVLGSISKINRDVNIMGMFDLFEQLQSSAEINRCNIIISEGFTTRRCSHCREINPPFGLEVRNFKCEFCGFTLDRDENSAINCYNQY